MIRVSSLRFRYPHAAREALDDLDLEVDEGRALALADRSGSGKTTLLKVLAGIAPRSTGGVVSGAAEIAGVALPLARGDLADRVGYVPQDPHAGCVAERVEDEIAFTAENLGVDPTRIAHRVQALLEGCGIGHLRRRRLATLSGGERQRVQIAAALIADPHVLLLDEPTSQLDPEGADSVRSLLEGLRTARGTTMLLAEHRIERLAGLVDQVVGRERDDDDLLEPWVGRRPRVAGAPAVLVEGAVVELGGRRVLDDLHLAVHEGEAVALVGPNGAGKTTLLRAILGFARPVRGAMHVAGAAAWVPQRPEAAFCRDRVVDEIALTLRARRSKRRPEAVLEEHGLAAFADRSPRHLSAGERLRVALCALTAGDPAVVLLDEPTRGLDAEGRRLLLGALDRWTGEGRAVLVATHDERLASACDRIAGLEDGRLETLRIAGEPRAVDAGVGA